MSQKTIVASCFGIIFVVISAAYIIHGNQLARSIYFLIPPLLAVVMGLYAVDTYKLDNLHGKVMAVFSGAMLCFFIGECLFLYFQHVLKIDPFPSVADVFYLSAYPLIFGGLIAEIRHHKVKWDTRHKGHVRALVLVFVALAALFLYFGVYKAYDPAETVLANIIAIGYGVNDILLMIPCVFALKIALGYRGGKLFYSWLGILGAIVLMMIADVMFAIFNQQYEMAKYPYTLIDLIQSASYLLFAYSFFYTAYVIRETRTRLIQKQLKRKA